MSFYEPDEHQVDNIAGCYLSGAASPTMSDLGILQARAVVYLRQAAKSASPTLGSLEGVVHDLTNQVKLLRDAVSDLREAMEELTPDTRRVVFRADNVVEGAKTTAA